LNTLSGSGKPFGQDSGRADWDQLPIDSSWRKNERFKAAVRYLLDNTYTKSLIRDLYPIEINRDFLTPGAVHLDIGPPVHHAQVIKHVGLDKMCGGSECITVLYGNMPARDVSYLDIPDARGLKNGDGGFMRWRWPELTQGKWALRASEKMPGYSLEQFDQSKLDRIEYQEYLNTKLNLFIAPRDRAALIAERLNDYLFHRIELTAIGHVQCHLQFCDPQGALYDDLSTPSKDRRFRERRNEFLEILKSIPESDPFWQELEELKIPVFDGLGVTIYDYLMNTDGISDQMSSDPSKGYSARWGLADDLRHRSLLTPTVFGNVWRFRFTEVSKALAVCQPDSGALKCDPNLAKIKQLSTARLDQGLRNLKRAFENEMRTADQAVLDLTAKIADDAYLPMFSGTSCPSGRDAYCTVFDYLLAGTNYIERMSSEPKDPLQRRMGLQ
jgi:hypothetical protein